MDRSNQGNLEHFDSSAHGEEQGSYQTEGNELYRSVCAAKIVVDAQQQHERGGNQR